jgi:VIT1/CCC1 family predicted Fe2+/Mn2+ transporter
MSMAAGEYVSVSSQADTEAADLDREERELEANPEAELAELATIYERRGLSPSLARQVATELSQEDALAAHTRDELGIIDHSIARPVQAALTSAITFTVGAALPLALVAIIPVARLVPAVAIASLIFLGVLGAIGARAGGAPVARATLRVTFWGALAMAATAGIGSLVGAVV